MAIHEQSKPFKCNLCDYETARKISLTQHHLKIHNKDPYKCPDCEFSTFKKSHLTLHQAIHKQIDNLYAEVESITPEHAHTCSQCDFIAHRKSLMFAHVAAHH